MAHLRQCAECIRGGIAKLQTGKWIDIERWDLIIAHPPCTYLSNVATRHHSAHCDCMFTIRFDGKSGVEGYDPDKLREQYDNAEGSTWNEKVNSLRREQYKVNGDKIRAQKRAAYERRQQVKGSTNTGDTNEKTDKKKVDFYAGPRYTQIVPAKYSEWIGDNKYQQLMRDAPGEEAKKYIRTAYRKGSVIGDGGTVAIRKFEKATGLNCGRNGNDHSKKVADLIRQIEKSLKRDVSRSEKKYLESELEKLKKA
ncbi:MAG: hypothetical protein ACOYJJ_09035 [Anaerovoracaceae bacterium]|jgi:hypothetical protein